MQIMFINQPHISGKIDTSVYQMLNVPVSQAQMWSFNIWSYSFLDAENMNGLFINPHFDVVFVRRLFVCLFLFDFVVLVLLSLLKDD